MPINTTPPPRIGKIGPYTVFLTPDSSPKPVSPNKTNPVQPVQPVQSHPVMAPPAQFYKQEPSSHEFFWDFVSKLQNAHESLDEHVAYWFGLNQSKYQWAWDDYYEMNGKNQTEEKAQVKPGKVQNV